MKTYYIYHINGVKIGCTSQIEKRMYVQGFTNYEILEEHTDIYLASDREIELQKQYGYPVDTKPYYLNASMVLARDQASYNNSNKSNFRTKEYRKLKSEQAKIQDLTKFNLAGSKSGKSRRNITFEQAQEIRSKWKFRVYTSKMLAKEYGITNAAVKAILQNRTYTTP